MKRTDKELSKPPLSTASWTYEREGICGRDVRWRLEPEKGIFTVTGLGPMEDYEQEKDVPWHRGRQKIRTVIIEEGVTEVGDRCFTNCRELTTLRMARSVEIIGVDSFRNCERIARLTLPGGLKAVSPGAFAGCRGLKTVYMPKTIESIEESAFGGDEKLTEIFYEGTGDQWREVLISRSCMSNESFIKAVLRPSGHRDEKKAGKEAGRVLQKEERNWKDEIRQVREALQKGGDGKLHILLLALKAAGVTSKTGDCTFLLFPKGTIMMIDAGIPECGSQVTGFLEEIGVKRLDYFILTHAHSDHIGGGMSLLNYLSEQGGGIGKYYYIDYYNKVTEVAFLQALTEGKTEICSDVAEGDRWVIDDVAVDVLGPDVERRAFSEDPMEGINNLSIVLKFTYGGCKYLTAGDLYVSQERWMAEKYGEALKADVVKASHHGLPTSSCKEWLAAVSPKVLLACTDDLGCTKVIRRARSVGADYYCTGMDGIIAVTMEDGGRWQIHSQFEDERMKILRGEKKDE